VKLILCFFLFCLQFVSVGLQAIELNEKKVAKTSTTSIEDDDDDSDDIEIGDFALDLVNGTHEVVSDSIIGVSDMIDNFFVEERMEEEGSSTRVHLSYFISEDIFGNLEHDYLFKARLSLPKTQNRLRLVVESTVNPEEDENLVAGSTDEERNSSFSTSLQYIFKKSKYWQVSSQAGVRFVVPPDPFAKLRIRRLFTYDQWIIRFVETLFITAAEGFGESSVLEFEHPIAKKLHFRSRSDLTVSQEVEDIIFIKTFSVYQKLTERQYLVYSTGTDIKVENSFPLQRYYLNMRFRHNFYKKWAFYEVVPEINFKRENDFEMLPLIFFKIDIVFGKI